MASEIAAEHIEARAQGLLLAGEIALHLEGELELSGMKHQLELVCLKLLLR